MVILEQSTESLTADDLVAERTDAGLRLDELVAKLLLFEFDHDGDGVAFDQNLANFSGDTSSFTPPDFQWPDAPVDNSLIIPDDSSQATPPGTSPNYDYTPFDWNSEKAYLSAVAGKAKLRDDQMLAAKAIFEAAQKDAIDAYNAAKGIIETAYENNVAGAETAYKNALVAGTNPVDMVAERAAYNAKAQQARDTYDLDLRNSADKFGKESAALLPAYMLDMVAINASYLAAMIAAGPHSVDPGELHDSLLRMANVNIDWTAAVEAREVQYATDQAGYAQDRAGRDAKALYKRDKALADLQDALDLSQAGYDYWNNQRTINAQKARTDALANFVLTREQALSEKARLRDNDIATARQVQSMSVATAAFDYTKGVAELRQVELHNYVDFQQTQAATYEMEIADHQVTYLTSLRPKYLLHEEALSGATKTEEFDQNQAKKTQADSIATAERDRAVDGSLALKKLQDASNLADMTRAGSNAYIWRTQDLARASAEKQNSLDLAAAQRNLSVDNAEASAAYEVAKKVVDRDYVYATDQAGQAAKAAELVVQQKVYSDAQADATFAYFDSTNTAQHDRADRRTLAAWNYLWSYGAVEQTALNSVNGAYTTFDVDVATADRKRSVALTAATGVYNVSIASADLTWWETAAPADEDYADQDAGFTETLSDDDTASWEGFQLAVATGFRDKIQTWSQSQNTAWASYRLKLAQDELDQVASQGEADLEQAESLSSAEVDRAQGYSLSAKDRALAEAAAYLAQVVSVAAANNTLAEQSGNALVTEATTVANATATHDGDMIYRNLIYQDVVDDEQKTLQYALDDAWAAYMLGLDEANRDRAKNLIDDATLSSRIAAATQTKRESEATAEESRANDLAVARQSWIHDTGVFNFDLADAIAGAANTRAGTVLEKTDEFAGTRAQAAKDLGEALAEQARDATEDGAEADAAYNLAASEAASPFAVSSDEASSTGRKADALARADYEIALYTAHKNKLATAATSENTPLATYQASVALADLTRATSDRAGLVTDQDALSEASADETGESNDAREAQVEAYSGEEGVDLVYAQQSAAAEKAVSIGYANAQADRVQEETHALAVETKDETAANVKYQKALAADRTLLDDSLAGVSVTWVSSMAYAKATLHAHPADSEAQYEYDFTQEAADLTRYDDSRAAAVEYAGNVGDDQIIRAEDLGDALIAAATALGQAGLDFTDSLNTADGIDETSINAAEATRDSSSSTADLAYEAGTDAAAHTELVSQDSASVIYQGVQGASSVIHAASTGLAEATYQIANAGQVSTRTATWATAVGTGAAAIKGAKAAAIAAWTSTTGPAFTSFVTAESQADATHDAAVADDAAALDDQNDTDSKSHDEAVAALSAAHDNSARTTQRAYGAGQLTREDAREAAFSLADKNYAVAYAADAKLYAVDITTAERTYQVALAGLVAGASTTTITKAKSDALANATLAQVIRQADADKEWLDKKTEANSALVTDTAPATATRREDLDALDEQKTEGLLAEDVARYAADEADATAAAADDEAAENDWETAQTSADDALVESEDADQASALSGLAATIGTPFAQYAASMASSVSAWWAANEPAQVAWTAAKNTAAALYQTTLSAAETVHTTAIDAAETTLTSTSATAGVTRDNAAMAATKTYALNLVAPTEAFIKANTLADRNQKVALATADRDKSVGKDADGNDFGTDEFTAATTAATNASESAKKNAASTYATAEAAARGVKLVSMAAADLQYTDTVGSAQQTKTIAVAAVNTSFGLAVSAANKLWDTSATAIDAARTSQTAESFSTYIASFSASASSPWSQSDAALASDVATDESAIGQAEEADLASVEDAICDETLAVENAVETLTDAAAASTHTWAHAVQNAVSVLVSSQAQARNSLAATGNYKPAAPVLPESPAGDLTLSITPASADDFFGSGLMTTDLAMGYDQFGSFISQMFGTSVTDPTNTGATTARLTTDRLRERVGRNKVAITDTTATYISLPTDAPMDLPDSQGDSVAIADDTLFFSADEADDTSNVETNLAGSDKDANKIADLSLLSCGGPPPQIVELGALPSQFREAPAIQPLGNRAPATTILQVQAKAPAQAARLPFPIAGTDPNAVAVPARQNPQNQAPPSELPPPGSLRSVSMAAPPRVPGGQPAAAVAKPPISVKVKIPPSADPPGMVEGIRSAAETNEKLEEIFKNNPHVLKIFIKEYKDDGLGRLYRAIRWGWTLDFETQWSWVSDYYVDTSTRTIVVDPRKFGSYWTRTTDEEIARRLNEVLMYDDIKPPRTKEYGILQPGDIMVWSGDHDQHGGLEMAYSQINDLKNDIRNEIVIEFASAGTGKVVVVIAEVASALKDARNAGRLAKMAGQSGKVLHGADNVVESVETVVKRLDGTQPGNGPGIIAGQRNRGAFNGMNLTGETKGGMPRVGDDWRRLRGPSAMRRHHLVPQEMLKDPTFMARMRALGYTDDEIVKFVNRQISDIPNVQHMQIHAEGWNDVWRTWLKRNPNFTVSDIREQMRSMMQEFELPRSSLGGPQYGK